MTAMCPHCGYDLVQDSIIERDGIVFDPRGTVTWQGQEVRLSNVERIVLHSLLKASGRTLNTSVLHERMGYDGDYRMADVMVCRIRKKLGPECPLRTDWGRGYYWRVERAEAA